LNLREERNMMNANGPFAGAKPYHVALSVADIDAAVEWYVEKLGADVTLSYEVPEIGVKAVFADVGGFEIEFVEMAGSQPHPTLGDPAETAKTQGFAHLTFEVEDCDACVASLREAGVEIIWEPQDQAQAGVRAAHFRDSEGFGLEVLHRL
jgi:predicted enzyme related to lactoylglutathione lyase